jgi:hypothetical protein
MGDGADHAEVTDLVTRLVDSDGRSRWIFVSASVQDVLQLPTGQNRYSSLGAEFAGQGPKSNPGASLLEGRLALDSLADLLWFGIFDSKMDMWIRQWTLANGKSVKLLEDTHAEGSEGECAIWPAGLVLARFLESEYANGKTLAGKVVVELGAGAAVGAITAASLGAAAYATEHPAAMAYMKASLKVSQRLK